MNKLFCLLLPVSLLSTAVLAVPPLPNPHHNGIRLNVMDVMINCDADRNMVLDQKELDGYKQLIGKYTAEVQTSLKPFAELDANKDNFITFDEYLAIPKVAQVPGLKPVHRHGPHGRHMPPPPHGEHGHHMPPPPHGEHGHHMPPPPHGEHGHHMPPPPHGVHGHHRAPMPNMKEFRSFNRFDLDHDGKLSRDEYAAFVDVKTKKNEKLRNLVQGMDFKTVDLNSDGGLSFKELDVYVKAKRLADAPSYKDWPKPPKDERK